MKTLNLITLMSYQNVCVIPGFRNTYHTIPSNCSISTAQENFFSLSRFFLLRNTLRNCPLCKTLVEFWKALINQRCLKKVGYLKLRVSKYHFLTKWYIMASARWRAFNSFTQQNLYFFPGTKKSWTKPWCFKVKKTKKTV